MSAYLNDHVVHLWFAFLVIVGVGTWCGIRHLARRLRVARGERN
jgi:hypothetical protein